MNWFCTRKHRNKNKTKTPEMDSKEPTKAFDMPRYYTLHMITATENSIVYKGKCSTTGKIVALKEDVEKLECVEQVDCIYEVIINKMLDHPCVLKLQELHITKSLSLYYVFDYIPQTLKEYRQSYGFDASTVPSLMHDLFTGIAYCHRKGILHLDLKPENMLITHDGRLKIADFGAAMLTQDAQSRPLKTTGGTLWYLSPELIMHDSLVGPPADIWAAGLILVEMYKSYPLLRGDSRVDQLVQIFRQFGTPTEETWPGCTTFPCFVSVLKYIHPPIHLNDTPPYIPLAVIDLLDHIFVYNLPDRYSADQCLSHHFLEKSGIKKE